MTEHTTHTTHEPVKTAVSPFKPVNDPTVVSGSEKTTLPNWTGEAHPLDGSPVKTVVAAPAGYQPRTTPKTVAEHNAEVDKLSREQFPA